MWNGATMSDGEETPSRTNGSVGCLDFDAVPPIDDIGDSSLYPDRLKVVPFAEQLGVIEKTATRSVAPRQPCSG